MDNDDVGGGEMKVLGQSLDRPAGEVHIGPWLCADNFAVASYALSDFGIGLFVYRKAAHELSCEFICHIEADIVPGACVLGAGVAKAYYEKWSHALNCLIGREKNGKAAARSESHGGLCV